MSGLVRFSASILADFIITPESLLRYCPGVAFTWTPRCSPEPQSAVCGSFSLWCSRRNCLQAREYLYDHPRAQTPLQFIGTGVAMEGLVLTGNVLFVAGSGQLVAWLSTEEGLLDGVVGDRRVGRDNSIWIIPLSLPCGDSWIFTVEGQVGVIKPDGNPLHAYHTNRGGFPSRSNNSKF